MKKVFFSISILLTGYLSAQNKMMSLPDSTSGISATGNTRGVAIGPGFDTPEGRLHIQDGFDDGTVLFLEAKTESLGNSDGTFTNISPDFFIRARFDGDLMPGNGEIRFSVDAGGKIQSGFYSTSVNDQLAVRNNMGIYSSVDRIIRFDLLGGEARMTWEAPGNNFQFVNVDNNTVALQLGENGQVGINTGNFFGDHDLFVDGSIYIYEDDTDNCQYSLLIEGTAIAEEMFIRINDGSWCDYVFEADYDLRTLYEVEEYIEENGHLPNIPSASEIEETGIPVGEMERLLTEKVEELTLYIIQMQKEINTLKEEIKKD